MADHLASTFRNSISAAQAKLAQVTEEAACGTLRPGGWSCKQIIGHLIDSALNNHQRFVRASLEASYEGPSYEQKGWVDMHGYSEMPWKELLAHWQRQNELLCSVVDRIPEDKYAVTCKIGDYAPATLRFVVEDYLTHLHEHVTQIAQAQTPGQLFIGYSLEKMRQMADQLKECVQDLSEEQIWQRSGDNANSIGNLVLHLAGNIRQWIGHGIGGLPDVRVRDQEFAARGGRSTSEILALFEKTISEAIEMVQKLPPQRLAERINPQNREVAMLEAIYQVVGHLQLHVGQIIFATKQMTGKDLGFFSRAKHTAR
jgi:uncharacterized damage-inducible protein DinB